MKCSRVTQVSPFLQIPTRNVSQVPTDRVAMERKRHQTVYSLCIWLQRLRTANLAKVAFGNLLCYLTIHEVPTSSFKHCKLVSFTERQYNLQYLQHIDESLNPSRYGTAVCLKYQSTRRKRKIQIRAITESKNQLSVNGG